MRKVLTVFNGVCQRLIPPLNIPDKYIMGLNLAHWSNVDILELAQTYLSSSNSRHAVSTLAQCLNVCFIF